MPVVPLVATVVALATVVGGVFGQAAEPANAFNVTVLCSRVDSFVDDASLAMTELAVEHANQHIFADARAKLVWRVVPELPAQSLDLAAFEVVDAVEADHAAAIFGPTTLASTMLVQHMLAADPPPQAGTSWPDSVGPRVFQLLPDVAHRTAALFAFLRTHGFGAIGMLVAETRESTDTARIVDTLASAANITLVSHELVEDPGDTARVRASLRVVRESGVRVVLVVADPAGYAQLAVAANAEDMVEGFVWLGLENTNTAAVSADALEALQRLRVVCADVPDLDHGSALASDLDARVRAMAADASRFPGFDPSQGLSTAMAFAYDSTVLLLSAINHTLATQGPDAIFDHAAVIASARDAVGLVGVTGTVRMCEDGQAVTTGVVVRQAPKTTTTEEDEPQQLELGAYDPCDGSFTAASSPVQWATADGSKPPNFEPESCGRLSVRNATTLACEPCPRFAYNDPADGREACVHCPDGFELEGDACAACAPGEHTETSATTGAPQCVPDDATNLTLVFQVGGGLAALVVVACTACLVRGQYQQARLRYHLAEKKARQESLFVAFVFHELRNPLNGVVASLEFIEQAMRELLRGWALEEQGKAQPGTPNHNRDHKRRGNGNGSGRGNGDKGPRQRRRGDHVPLVSQMVQQGSDSEGSDSSCSSFSSSSSSSSSPARALSARQGARGRGRGRGRGAGKRSVVMAEPAPSAHELEAAHRKELVQQHLSCCLRDIATCQTCTSHAMDILNTVLDFSKVAEGKFKLNKHPVCVDDLLGALLAAVANVNRRVDMRAVLVADGVETPVVAGPRAAGVAGCWVLADGKRLSQVLLNLVVNGLQHTRSGFVELVVEVTRTEATEGSNSSRSSNDNGHSNGNGKAERRSRSRFSLEMGPLSHHNHNHKQDHNHDANHAHGADPVRVRVEVRDSGSGISDEDKRRLFNLYEQLEQAGTHKASGSGIGLMLSKSLVGLLGGELCVESPWSEGHSGTRFHFEFDTALAPPPDNPEPSKAQPAAASDPHAPAPAPTPALPLGVGHSAIVPPTPVLFRRKAGAGGARQAREPERKHDRVGGGGGDPKRVLVVDDLRLNRTILKRKLTSPPVDVLELQVHEACTGEEAVELITEKGERFDLVLMDERMADAGGKLLGSEAARLIRAWEREAGAARPKPMAIVACSGNASASDHDAYREAGMDDLLSKPLPPQQEFLAKLQGWLAL